MVQKVEVSKHCVNCMYSNYYSLNDRYECRRYPPQVRGMYASDFPRVDFSDWCGEFKEKENG